LGSYLWSRGRLRRLPPGALPGVPDRIGPLLRSGLLSPAGVLRAGLDLVLPRRVAPGDATVAELLRPRFGSQVVDRIVEPVLAGVHAGRATQLSAGSTVPEVDALVRGNRSVYLALRRRRRAAAPAGPAMVSLRGGLSGLTDALAGSLSDVEICTGTPVTRLERAGAGFGAGFVVGLADGSVLTADAVVLATPAFGAAALVEQIAPGAGEPLRAIPYVDVATVILAYPRAAAPPSFQATGFLVPPAEDRLLVGCTWLSAKWPHLGDRPSLLVRGMVGRAGDRRWAELDDDTLVAQVHREVSAASGITEPPAAAIVQRWPQALPQYVVGHGARLEQLAAALAAVPGLYVTGAAYRGAGVASCVAQASKTATAVLDYISTIALTARGTT
jgi:oxygen-dependent protoporphyrinogen oxidase